MIFITGMPGVGKTYWGSLIADKHGWQFVDLDSFIEQHEKTTIAVLFENEGETNFRKKEHQYLAGIIDEHPFNTIIACGGGTPCFHENIGMMKQAGKVVYLKAGIDHLLNNLKNETAIRPLLKQQKDTAAYLANLLIQRSPFYEQADYILQSENISLTTFDQIISACTNRQ